ncbi:hypothetical protein AOQ84DRAFT_361126 [Glonium stellatum]|uniref:VIT domain-containing protein n=1 Tax=Glonium stellatum TaxID=574774 RepID=A0A8E2F7I4_9PEZI|nr:hypothetical protein AOQ84DRAFT_361126 [Glonium stellatum]
MAYPYRSNEETDFERLPSGVFFDAQQPEAASTSPPWPRTHQEEIWSFPEFYEAEDASFVSINVDVNSTISRTTLTQTFPNNSNICFFVGDDKVLEGQVKRTAEAKAEYKKAIEEQRIAALLEEHTPEVFETYLSNISPKINVKIDMVYINELDADVGGEGILVTIPKSVAPRYGMPPNNISEDSNTRITGDHIKKGLSIKVEVTAAVPIRKLEPHSSHFSRNSDLARLPEPMGTDPQKACAILSDRSATLGKDFVLLVPVPEVSLLQSRALIETTLDQRDLSEELGDTAGVLAKSSQSTRMDSGKTVIRMLKGALPPASWKCEITLPGVTASEETSLTSTMIGNETGCAVSLRRPAYIQAPYQVHSLHPFARSSIFFLFNKDQGQLPRAVNVKATYPSETISVDIPVEHVNTRLPTVHHLAAKRIILDLEAGHSWIHASTPHSRTLGKRSSASLALDELVRQEAECIGLKWAITGKWTSFVAVDHVRHTEDLVGLYKPSRSELADLTRPRNSATNWYPSSMSNAGHNDPPTPDVTYYSSCKAQPYGLPRSPGRRQRISGLPDHPDDPQSPSEVPELEGSPSERSSSESGYNRMCELPNMMSLEEATLGKPKTFEGSFRLSCLAVELRENFLERFNFVDITELEALLSSKPSWTLNTSSGEERKQICETFIVIFFIRNQFPELKDLWQLIVEKAGRWVASSLQEKKDRDDVEKWIKERYQKMVVRHELETEGDPRQA